mmetsp:Transcript_16205/g.25891  ORF Transcript_16205/g.25891 Transcript_16205/m.25891 type:complete len:225 (-) Transcript_16205:247-921(-)
MAANERATPRAENTSPAPPGARKSSSARVVSASHKSGGGGVESCERAHKRFVTPCEVMSPATSTHRACSAANTSGSRSKSRRAAAHMMLAISKAPKCSFSWSTWRTRKEENEVMGTMRARLYSVACDHSTLDTSCGVKSEATSVARLYKRSRRTLSAGCSMWSSLNPRSIFTIACSVIATSCELTNLLPFSSCAACATSASFSASSRVCFAPTSTFISSSSHPS